MGKANNWSRLQATAVASHLWASAQSAPGGAKLGKWRVSSWVSPSQPQASTPFPPSCSPDAQPHHGSEGCQSLLLLPSADIIPTSSWLASVSSPAARGGTPAAASNGEGEEESRSSAGKASSRPLEASWFHSISQCRQRGAQAATPPLSTGQTGSGQLEGAF